MATGTAGTSARHFVSQQTHYLIKKVVFGDDGNELSMGYVPAGSIVVDAYAVVKTVFNGDGASTLDIGYADDSDEFATDIDIKSSVGKIVDTAMATAGNLVFTADTEIVCQWDSADATNLTTGLAYAVVEYVVDQAVVDA